MRRFFLVLCCSAVTACVQNRTIASPHAVTHHTVARATQVVPPSLTTATLPNRSSLTETVCLRAIPFHQRAARERVRLLRLASCARGASDPAFCAAPQTSQQRSELAQQQAIALATANMLYDEAIRRYRWSLRTTSIANTNAQECTFNLADALFWSGRYDEAALEYAQVRDHGGIQFRASSALMAVRSAERQLLRSVHNGSVSPCDALRVGLYGVAPETIEPDSSVREQCVRQYSSQFVRQTIPPLVAAVMEARAAYVRRVSSAIDTAQALQEVFVRDDLQLENTPPFANKFRFLNARTLLRFGHVEAAEEALLSLFRARIADDALIATALYRELFELYSRQQRHDAIERLSAEAMGQTPPCYGPRIPFREGLQAFHDAERGSVHDALESYRRAARELLIARQQEPNHPQVALVDVYIAMAYERSQQYHAAALQYRQVLDQYESLAVVGSNPPVSLQGEEQTQRRALLAFAQLHLGAMFAVTAQPDRALEEWSILAIDEDIAATHDSVQEARRLSQNLRRTSGVRIDPLLAYPRNATLSP